MHLYTWKIYAWASICLTDNAKIWTASHVKHNSGLIIGLCPANERQRYFVTTSLIGCVQA